MENLVIDLTGDDDEDSELEPPPSKATVIDLRIRSTKNLDDQQPCSSKGLVATPWFPLENQANNGENSSKINGLIENDSRKCLSCNLIPEQPVKTECDHLHCYKCFSKNLIAQNLIFPKCCSEYCQVILTEDFIKSTLNLKDYVKFLEAHCRFLRDTLIFREYNSYMESAVTVEPVKSNSEIDKDTSYQTNFFEFECPICFERIHANEGVMLKSCSHTFCRLCISETVKHCDDYFVICPHRNSDGSACDANILECELKAIVPKEIHDLLMKKRIDLWANSSNVFHCKTPDCDGFILTDGSAKAFPCIICDKINCIPCEAIHETKTCEQHREDLLNDEKNQRELQMTQAAVQNMLDNGNAILCAKCGSVIQKIDGKNLIINNFDYF